MYVIHIIMLAIDANIHGWRKMASKTPSGAKQGLLIFTGGPLLIYIYYY